MRLLRWSQTFRVPHLPVEYFIIDLHKQLCIYSTLPRAVHKVSNIIKQSRLWLQVRESHHMREWPLGYTWSLIQSSRVHNHKCSKLGWILTLLCYICKIQSTMGRFVGGWGSAFLKLNILINCRHCVTPLRPYWTEDFVCIESCCKRYSIIV